MVEKIFAFQTNGTIKESQGGSTKYLETILEQQEIGGPNTDEKTGKIKNETSKKMISHDSLIQEDKLSDTQVASILERINRLK